MKYSFPYISEAEKTLRKKLKRYLRAHMKRIQKCLHLERQNNLICMAWRLRRQLCHTTRMSSLLYIHRKYQAEHNKLHQLLLPQSLRLMAQRSVLVHRMKKSLSKTNNLTQLTPSHQMRSQAISFIVNFFQTPERLSTEDKDIIAEYIDKQTWNTFTNLPSHYQKDLINIIISKLDIHIEYLKRNRLNLCLQRLQRHICCKLSKDIQKINTKNHAKLSTITKLYSLFAKNSKHHGQSNNTADIIEISDRQMA